MLLISAQNYLVSSYHLLRVKCCDLKQQQWLLMNARKLHKFKQVCMNLDLT